MTGPRPNTTTRRISKSTANDRRFESETVALQSLRLIAAPNHEDDLSDEELANICQDPTHSSDLIKTLIACIKSI